VVATLSACRRKRGEALSFPSFQYTLWRMETQVFYQDLCNIHGDTDPFRLRRSGIEGLARPGLISIDDACPNGKRASLLSVVGKCGAPGYLGAGNVVAMFAKHISAKNVIDIKTYQCRVA